MGMIKLTGSLADSNRKPTDKQIDFELHEDLIEMTIEEKYYFQNEDGVFLSEIAVDGDLYVEIKKTPLSVTMNKRFGTL